MVDICPVPPLIFNMVNGFSFFLCLWESSQKNEREMNDFIRIQINQGFVRRAMRELTKIKNKNSTI